LHDEVPGNVAAEFHYGDTDKVAGAFADAANVTRLSIPSNRIVVCPMEPRSAIADYDPTSERWTLRVGCQRVFGLRNGLAAILGIERDKVRVFTGTLDYGQGHWTPFAQLLHQTLGIPFDRIRLLQGDSEKLVAGGGTGGSKSLMASGTNRYRVLARPV
jgi:CO/xanthine dehydrogenase Mo-binding subunit